MENRIETYLVNRKGTIEYRFDEMGISNIGGTEEKIKWAYDAHAKTLGIFTKKNPIFITLPYKFENISALYLSNDKMLFNIKTDKSELFVTEDKDIIDTGIIKSKVIFSNIIRENNIALFLDVKYQNGVEKIIDIMRNKFISDVINLNTTKLTSEIYAFSDDYKIIFYNIKTGEMFKVDDKQYIYRNTNYGKIKKETYNTIVINDKKYFTFIENESMSIINEKFEKQNIDTGDILYVVDTKYMKFNPKNTYVCVDKNQKNQIYEFSDSNAIGLGEKFENITWVIGRDFVLCSEEQVVYPQIYKFINWKGEIIKDIVGDIKYSDYDGKIGKCIIELRKEANDTPKYAAYTYYDDDFHRESDYYSDITKNGNEYKCTRFDNNIIKMDKDFNIIEDSDIVEKATKYKNYTLELNKKEHKVTLKHNLYGNIITGEVPYNIVDIIVPKEDRKAYDSVIVKTSDSYLLYNSDSQQDYEKICSMDGIVPIISGGKYYLANNNEKSPYSVRLIKLNKENKLSVNKHKIITVIICDFYPHTIYYYDGETVGEIQLKSNKVVFRDYLSYNPNINKIADIRELKPGIYILDVDNKLKREGY